jgi:hypothetical protein
MDLKIAKQKYDVQKAGAKSRGIEWLFTFETWVETWEQSGKWERRGNKIEQYCMARKGDVGPYAPINVDIKLHSENSVEGNKGKPRKTDSDITKLRRSLAALGNKSNLNKKFSIEHKMRISKANKGKPSSLKGISKSKIQCPHCNTIGGGGSMQRWHMDNCKAINISK